jgi:hypothetical protein
VEKREELEEALAATWDRDTLAVYADHLQAEGDPRGELIALDLEIEAHGNSVELSKRRTSLMYAWLGSLVPVANVHGSWVGDSLKFGFVENLELDDTITDDSLERVLASPAGPYIRGITIKGRADAIDRIFTVLAQREHRWLTQMSLGNRDGHYLNTSDRVDSRIAARAFAAMPRLRSLTLFANSALADLSHPTIETLALNRDCYIALGEGATFDRVSTLVITNPNAPTYEEYIDELADEPPTNTKLPNVAFPSLRRLEVDDDDLAAACKLVRSISARAHVTSLRISRLRNAADRDELISLMRDMPALEVIEVAHGTHYDPPDIPNVRLERADLLAWPMQEAADELSLRIFMPGSKYGETVTAIDAVYVMEQRFESLPAPAQAAWSQLWRCVAALKKQAVEFPARTLADAVEAVPELMQNGWRELREELSSRRPLSTDAMVKIERC